MADHNPKVIADPNWYVGETLRAAIEENVTPFAGTIYFVSAVSGSDANTGLSPENAFQTIQHAIDTAAAGDGLSIKGEAYDEAITVDKRGLELWFEIGTSLSNTAGGTVVTVSANSCRLHGEAIIFASAGDTCLSVTGNDTTIYRIRARTGAVGFDIQGLGAFLEDCGAATQTTTHYLIRGANCRLRLCRAAGDGSATRGYYINNNIDYCRMQWCESSGNGTSGFEIAIGSNYCIINDCVSGRGDGDRIDAGEFNMWSNFAERMEEEHHEEIYPMSAGVGVAGDNVTINNSTTDDAGGSREDQNYWGDVVRIIPQTAIATAYWSYGIYIAATTAADIQQWQALFTDYRYTAYQDGGNDWDKNETELTVDDGSIFLADDLIWVFGNDRTNGEIQKVDSVAGNVLTIVGEARASGGLGLRYDYDTDASANMVCLVYRATDRRFHPINGEYSAAGARHHARYNWQHAKRIEPYGAMLMRMLNATDAAASAFDVRAIYSE